ncbi:uncharacterized protein LOC131308822 isoform X2 [Rhododendron vialii]|uniref:uncharacterized protein LOC131308822 isoform X2 n=1 Tax=Rhododendron vialii TaxID=182163 RepID=UPI00265F1E1B|nr:uncharacterized protein LOC131308822 isoform X2 [Rhododendron vialii]
MNRDSQHGKALFLSSIGIQLSEDGGADPESDPSFASSSRSAEHLTNFSSLAPYFDIQQIDSDGKVQEVENNVRDLIQVLYFKPNNHYFAYVVLKV